MGAHFVPFALEAHTARLNQVGNGGDGFAFTTGATAHQLDKLAQVVNRPLDFAWDLFHNSGSLIIGRAEAVPWVAERLLVL